MTSPRWSAEALRAMSPMHVSKSRIWTAVTARLGQARLEQIEAWGSA
ncbi:hypothetical protein SPF06_21530 [Sinomonas sp. JGH33]|uniref:Uncharacterized protein n=1 Tax=Sinomonas terricola TaxID=3110330 RepID=A0ABU5TC90_9MICC|nr:hypothetical protein [Sinomonas sp. JGH33]MEA5457307.1 hypothetical protein [Sinomonas sp. JGH33]